MTYSLRLSPSVVDSLRCPACGGRLQQYSDRLVCANPSCERVYPIHEGIPVIIDENKSIFSITELTSRRKDEKGRVRENRLKKAFKSIVPTVSNNLKARQNYLRFAAELEKQGSAPPYWSLVAVPPGWVFARSKKMQPSIW
jgi:uncharacterized protein YbaR (Trm112 family)